MVNKVALITGASSGIGKATALQLLKEGYTVYGAARSVEKMEDLRRNDMHVLKMDVTDDSMVEAGVNQIINEQGRIDVLVNNAGYGSYGAIEDVPLEEARRQFDVNIFGLARLTQLVLPLMRKQRFGKIVNISSVGGKIYTPMGGWYHATKHALEGWSDCLRLETQQFGIDVIIVEPGLIKTRFGDVLERQIKISGTGAYSDMAKKIARANKRYYEDPRASPPQVIADTISAALRARKPKTRYAAGRMAKTILFFRKRFSDRRFDKTVMGMVN